jgi:hypothetical protein
MRDGEDGEAFLYGELGKRREDFADDGVEVGIVGADEGVHRVDDDEAAVGSAVEGGAELAEVVAEIGDGIDVEDAVAVGALGVEAGADGVGEVVFGVE